MTEPSALDHVKLVGKTVAAVLGGLGVMAYLVRLLQYRLHGLPFDGEVSVETYLLAVGLLLTIGQSAVLVVGPLLAVAWGGRLVRARIFPGGATGGRRFLAWLTLGAVVLLTLLLPAGQIGSTPPIWGAASAPAVASLLVREDGAWLVVSGLAVGGLGLALVPLGRLLLQARLRIPSWPQVVACAALATVALSFFLPIIAATLPAPGGTLPRGSVHLRAPADGWVAGYLLPLSGQDLLVLPASPDVQEVEILPRENIGRIVFFAGGGKSMNDLMKERWKGEKKPLRIGGMPFGGWGALSAVVLTLGFVFCGGGVRAAEPPEPPAEEALPPWALGFFPLVSAAGSDLLQQIQAVMALYTRGDEGQGGAVWRQRGTNDAQCVTSGGGYTSPRPGRDGRQIAVLRDGRPRILDLDTGEETPVPGTATYQRLYGWNEAAGTLLLQAGPQVVSVALADGSATPLAAVSSETGTQLDALTRLTPEGAALLVRHTGGVWAIMERRPGEATGRRVVSRPVPLAEPAWSAAGVVFLAPPP